MTAENNPAPSLEQYILVSLIDVYRGLNVNLPVDLDQQVQNNVIRDVLSLAISFAEKTESMQIISDELFKCVQGGCLVKDQMIKVQGQNPDIINAKMLAAAQLLKQENKKMNLN